MRRTLVTATCLAALAAGTLLPAAPAQAAGWRAVVVGQSGRGADTAFADSYYASDSLRASGLGQVTLLRDAPSGSLLEVLSGLPAGENVMIYYAGPLGDDGRSLAMAGGEIDLANLLGRLGGKGHNQVALLLEDCTARGPEPNGLAALPVPAGMQVQIVASAGPGGTCPQPGERLTDRLTTAQAAQEPVPFEDMVTGLWTNARLADAPLLFDTSGRPAAPAASNSPVVSVVAASPVTASPVISPVISGATITGTAPAAPSGNGDAVVIFAAQPITNRMAAVPREDGMPEPSIIVGIIEQPAEDTPAEDQPQDPTTDIAYDDVEGRRALRQSDPTLYQTLVDSGAFDPPEAVLASAIQTELARMGCYTSTIDGIWGNGSRGAVQRYFDELSGVTAVSLEPVVQLFRQVIGRDDVACPAPVVQPVATQPRPAPAPTPAPAPAPAQDSGTTGGANFGNFFNTR